MFSLQKNLKENCLNDDAAAANMQMNLQSENFDEHLTGNCVEFDDNMGMMMMINEPSEMECLNRQWSFHL
jgi:hypothetical protein